MATSTLAPPIGSPPAGLLGAPPAGPPEAPDPYQNHEALLKFFKECKEEAFEDRAVFERGWWRNLLYELGNQWITEDQRAQTGWRPKNLAKWIPKPVTNIVAETVATIRAVFTAVQLGVIARPNGQDPQHVATAEIVDELHPCIHAEHDMDRTTREQDFWLSTCANAFLHIWWDKRAETNGTFVVPFEECLTCGTISPPEAIVAAKQTCPQCGGSSFKSALTKTGEPQGQTINKGKGTTDALSPFEIAVPSGYNRFADVPFVIRLRWRTKRYYEAHHAELAGKIQWQRTPHERSLELVKSLATQNDVSSQTGTGWFRGSGGETGHAEGIAEYELCHKPTQTYPEGLLLRVAGDSDPIIVADQTESVPGPLPYSTIDGRKLFPYIHVGFEQFGGRLWAKGPVDLIIQKQDQINQVDSIISLHAQRAANSYWLKPKNADVSAITGEPGIIIEYNAMAGGQGAKPERVPGDPINHSLFQYRDQLLADVERLAGTFDITKGQKPQGVSAFSSLQLLVERSQSRFSLVLSERGEAYRQWFALAIELERQFGPEQRVFSILGPNRRWTYRHFENANLQGSISIVVEDGSQVPKTNLGKRAAIEQANQLRMINPQDPDQVYAIFKDFGISHLLPGLDTHVKAALTEQDAFERWASSEQSIGIPDPMTGAMVAPPSPLHVKRWHNDDIHLAELQKWANSDRMRQMFEERPDLELQVDQHMQAHEQARMMKQAALQAPPPGPQVPAGPEPGGAGRALANSNQESGQPSDLPSGAGLDAQGRGPE